MGKSFLIYSLLVAGYISQEHMFFLCEIFVEGRRKLQAFWGHWGLVRPLHEIFYNLNFTFQYSKMRTPLYSEELDITQSPGSCVSFIPVDLQESTARLLVDLYPHGQGDHFFAPSFVSVPKLFLLSLFLPWPLPSNHTRTSGSILAFLLKGKNCRMFGKQ